MELLDMLTAQLGIDETQASGGAGILFKIAREKLGSDFSQISDVLPKVAELMNQAPEAGGGLMGAIGSLAGALGADNLGDLAEAASGFSKLNLDPGMIAEFLPIILEFIKDRVGEEPMKLLASVLKAV